MEGSHNLSADAKKRYKIMIEQHNAQEANKKKNKEGKSKLQIFAEKLYGGGK
tara:strand:- start:619 stop:774 length:156 start_codon:yes stop_codon:yes gene_type:complete